MTTPGGSGPIETAYIEIKPRVSASFAAEVRKDLLPILKKIGNEADAAFKRVENASKAAAVDIGSVTTSLKAAETASGRFARAAVSDAARAGAAYRSIGSAGMGSFSNLGREVARTSRNVEGLNRQFSFTRYVVRNIARAAIISAGAAVAGLGAYAVVTAGKLEQIQIAFDGLMGSAKAGEAFTARLQDFAAKTPFDFEGLAKASQRLLSIGQTGDEAIATLRTVGDAASAAGQGSEAVNRVVTALAQIQSKGKLSAEEMNQVAEALPNFNRGKVIENLAEAFGVTTEKIKEMQSKGLIPAQAGIDAMVESLKEVPGALGAMDRQALTLAGRFETFKDTINRNISESIQDSLPALGAALGSLTDIIDEELKTLGPAIGQGLTTLAPFVGDLVQAVGPILTSIFEDITPLLAALGPALIPLGDAIALALSSLGPALLPLAHAIAEISTAVGPLIGIIGVELGNAILALSPLIDSLATIITGSLANAAPVLAELLAAVAPLVETLAIALVPIVDELGLAMIGLIPSLLPVVLAFTDMVVALTPLIQLLSVALVNSLHILIPILEFTASVSLAKLEATFKVVAWTIREVVVPTIRFFVDFAIEAFLNLLKAAEQAFGWVPGLGGKLQQASNHVSSFRDSVNASLDGIQREVNIVVRTTYVTAKVELNNIQDEKRFAREHRAKTIAEAAKKTTVIKGPRPQFLTPSGGGGGSSSGGGGASKAASAAKKAAADAQRALVKLADAALDAAKKVADGIKVQLDSASDTLKKLRDQFADIRDSIAEAFSVNLFESRSAKQFLKKASRNIKTNATVLQSQNILQSALGKQAGSSEFLKQLFESGNTRLIKNLANESNAVLTDVLAKFNQDKAAANRIGTAVAEAFIVGGKPLVIGIANVREEVIRLQKLMVAALAKVEAATKARDRLKAAAGGIFGAATDIQVGEAGREVVVPLTRPARALELLLQSGALGLPTVAAHLGSLQNAAESQSMDRLRAVGLRGGPTYARTPERAAQTSPPMLKVVKERTVNQTFHISEAGDARLTAASVAARTASHMDR